MSTATLRTYLLQVPHRRRAAPAPARSSPAPTAVVANPTAEEEPLAVGPEQVGSADRGLVAEG